VCMGIALSQAVAILLWIIISTSTYTPAMFDTRFNGGDLVRIPEPKFQGGHPFSMLNFMSLTRSHVEVVSKTYDVRNYSEIPRYPKGDFSKFGYGYLHIEPSPWEERLRLDVLKDVAFVNHSDLPVIISVHGGAYIGGSRKDVDIYELLLQGYAIVSLSYRFLEYGYSARDLVGDIIDGFEWVVSEGPMYGLDPYRVMFVGVSSGGHLALLSSIILNEKYPGRVRVVVNMSGPTEFIWFYKNAKRGTPTEGAFLLHNVAMSLANVSSIEDPELEVGLRWMCPSSHLNNTNFTFVTVHGMSDWLSPNGMSVLFHEKLENQGIPNYLISMPTTGHASVIWSQYLTHIVERCAAKFLL